MVNSLGEVVTLSRLGSGVQNSIVTKSPGSGTVTRLRPRSSMGSASAIESVNIEEESDEEDQEACDQCQTEEARSGKERRKSRLKFETKLKIELSTISTVMEVKGQQIMRIKKYVYFTVQGGREIPRQDGVNESKIVRTPQQYDCECERCTRMADWACQDKLSFPAMQVTSSHVSIWFDFPAS